MTLVKRTFILFLAAFLLQMLLILGLIYFGYSHSEGQWKTRRLASIEETAVAILSGEHSLELPQDIPISVYDARGNLTASNRGAGRTRSAQEHDLIPIQQGGSVIGYYSTGLISFRTSPASRELIESMTRAIAAGILLSLGISLAAAAYFSRQVSRPAQSISSSLTHMIAGTTIQPAELSGCEEMTAIAQSVHTLQQWLQQEQVIRSQWAQDIAHDLRTPVASMKAQFEAMADGVLPVTPERIEKTSRELYRMEMLINDLETLMKLESPEMSMGSAEIDSSCFARELQSRFPGLLLDSGNTQFSFFADEQLLYRAVSNLITNAFRHAGPGTQVSLKLEHTASSVVLSVHNTGSPIPEEDIPNVFNRLYRGEYARKTPGSGLGLTIVKRIAELHHGTVEIFSTEKTGTTVSIHIPQ